ncbi:uncharacterized protein LOC130257296 isoform X2 [Oenanthe melanoleuca]|uniref:uncharacterized protein LOC130257296 isoform X2 n=1 Tax=Oenanthe melanoleuca TaxID=2939378 RepID=UPI0024C1A7CE|nr:uncharacterized protein LOC130257296 isoform X2 [Oenanthe melanoleuca]
MATQASSLFFQRHLEIIKAVSPEKEYFHFEQKDDLDYRAVGHVIRGIWVIKLSCVLCRRDGRTVYSEHSGSGNSPDRIEVSKHQEQAAVEALKSSAEILGMTLCGTMGMCTFCKVRKARCTGSEKEQDSVWDMLVEDILFCSLSCVGPEEDYVENQMDSKIARSSSKGFKSVLQLN